MNYFLGEANVFIEHNFKVLHGNIKFQRKKIDRKNIMQSYNNYIKSEDICYSNSG